MSEARADVERIAAAFQNEGTRILHARGLSNQVTKWTFLPEEYQDAMRAVAEELLHADVIRVGARPRVERPMDGQTTIDDELHGEEGALR